MKSCLCILALVVVGFCAAAPGAVSYTWSGPAAGAWDDAANWGGSGYPIAGDTAIFSLAGANPSVTVTGSQAAATITLTGSNGTLTLLGTGSLTVANAWGPGGPSMVQGLYGTATINGPVSLKRNGSLGGTLTINPTSAISLAGGPFSFNPGEAVGSTHGTAGTLTINGNLTLGYSGGRTLNFDLSSNPANCDRISLGTGIFTYTDTNSVVFNIFDKGGFGVGSYTLFTYGSSSVTRYSPSTIINGPSGGPAYCYMLQDTGTALKLTVGHSYTWAGAASDDWGVSGSWTSATGTTTPQATDGATFSAGAHPTINGTKTVGNLTLNGAFVMNGPGTLAVNNALQGTGSLTISAGTFALNCANSLTSTVVINGGTLGGNWGSSGNGMTLTSGTLGGSLIVDKLTATGGTVSPGGTGAIGAFTNSGGAPTTYDTSFDNVTFEYDLSYANTTPLQGVYSPSNGYCNDYFNFTTGGTANTIPIGNSFLKVNALPGFASLAGANTYTIIDYSWGTFMKGSGTLTITGPVPSIVQGGTTYLSGTTAVDTDGTTGRKITATFTRVAGATFAWTGGGGGGWWNAANWDLGFVAPIAGDIANVSLSGSPTIDLSSLTLQTGASTNVTLVPAIGTLTLVGSGTATLANGTLNATSPVTVASGQTIQGNATVSGGGISLTGGILGGSLSVGNVTATAGTIGGTATVSGSLTVNSGGGLLVNSTIAPSSVVVNAGGTLKGTGTINQSVTVSGGTLGGQVSIGGTVAFTGGQFTPGADGVAGVITVTSGGMTLASDTALNFDLGGGACDRVDITGNLTLDGTLNVTALAGFGGASSYRLFNYSGFLTDNGLVLSSTRIASHTCSVSTATANQVNLLLMPLGDTNLDGVVNALDIDRIYDVINVRHPFDLAADVNGDGLVNQDDVTYELNHVLLTNYGDANLDKFTDFTDFQVLLDHWQGQAGWASGDWTGDQLCDFSDFQKLLDYWNPTGWSFAQSQVPEPASLSLLALGAMALLRRKK